MGAEALRVELDRPVRIRPIRSEHDLAEADGGAARLAAGACQLVRLGLLRRWVTIDGLIDANDQFGLLPDLDEGRWGFEDAASWIYLMVLLGHWEIDPPLNPVQIERWTVGAVSGLHVHLCDVDSAESDLWGRAAFHAVVRASGRLDGPVRRVLVAEVLTGLVEFSERHRHAVDLREQFGLQEKET